MKRFLTLCLAAVMLLSVSLTGCGTEKEPASASASTVQATTAATAATAEEKIDYFHKYEPEISLTFNTIYGTDLKFRDGEDANNNAFTRWAKKELGIVWTTKFVAPSTDENKSKLNISMASGDIPDCVFGEIPDLAKYANAGLLTPLDELIDKYGSPLTKYVLAEADKATGGNFFTPYILKGKKYAMPTDADIWGRTWHTTFIRKDILDELGKAVPQTLDQMEDVLAAYKAKYPKGVGMFLQKDLIGTSGKVELGTVGETMNAYPGYWLEKDGKLAYGSVQPETKAALQKLADWYKKGYIDREFLVKDFNKAAEALSQGNMLSITGDWWYVWWPFPDLMKNVPTAKMVATSLNSPSGAPRFMAPNPFSYAMGISTSCKNPEAFIYELNEQIDSNLRQKTEIREKMKSEFNYEFKYPVESEAALTPKDPKAESYLQEYGFTREGPGAYFNTVVASKVFGGFQFLGGVDDSLKAVQNLADAYNAKDTSKLSATDLATYNTLKDTNKTLDALVSEVGLANKLTQANGSIVLDKYVGAPTKTMIEKKAYLDKLESETFIKIIIGSSSIDTFDKFVTDWQNAGGNDITNEVNEWYTNLK